MENSRVVPHKIKNRSTIWPSNSTAGYIPQRIKSKDLNRYLYTCVYSTIIFSSQKMSISGWLDKQNVYTQERNAVVIQSLSHAHLVVTSWTAAHQTSLSFTVSLSLLRLMSNKSVMPSNHLILYHPLLIPRSIFPSIRVFSNESALRIRKPKYWSSSFSISPSN